MRKIKKYKIVIASVIAFFCTVFLLFAGFVIYSEIENRNTKKVLAAIEANDMKALKKLIDSGVDVNASAEQASFDCYGKYWDSVLEEKPLRVAVNKNNYQAVKMLVEAGADINYCDLSGWSHLFCAIADESYEIAYYLIENGANLCYGEKSCCIKALLNNHWNEDSKNFLQFLLKEKEISVTHSEYGHLFLDASGNSYDDSGFLQYFMDNYEIDINMKAPNGNTPLMESASEGNIDICKFLLKNGADKALTNSEGKTALNLAIDAQERNKELEELLQIR